MTGRPDGRSAVRSLAAARFVSSGGTQAAQVALAYSVYEQTHSAAWVSASLVATAGIVGAMGPVSGRLSDRFDRRRVMVVSELAGALGWLVVLLAARPLTLVLAALLATAANAPFKASSNAAVPNLVGADDLPWANGVIATALNAAMVAGPLLGGALLGAAGADAVFGINVVTFTVSALVLRRLRGSFADAEAPRTARATWRTVLADPVRRQLMAITSLSFGAFGLILVADVPFVDELGGGSVAYALLTTLWGLGAVVGSWAAGRLPARLERRAIFLGAVVMGGAVTSFVVLPGLPAVIAAGAIGGVGSGVVFPPWYSLLQRSAPDAERGTTFALAESLEQAAFLAGMTAAGGLVAWLGPQASYAVPGALLLLAAAVARPQRDVRPVAHDAAMERHEPSTRRRPSRTWGRSCPTVAAREWCSEPEARRRLGLRTRFGLRMLAGRRSVDWCRDPDGAIGVTRASVERRAQWQRLASRRERVVDAVVGLLWIA